MSVNTPFMGSCVQTNLMMRLGRTRGARLASRIRFVRRDSRIVKERNMACIRRPSDRAEFVRQLGDPIVFHSPGMSAELLTKRSR